MQYYRTVHNVRESQTCESVLTNEVYVGRTRSEAAEQRVHGWIGSIVSIIVLFTPDLKILKMSLSQTV